MFSIIAPLDANRLEQFLNTKRVYDSFPVEKEFLLPTRSYDAVRSFLKRHDLLNDVSLLPYSHEVGFNPSMALNLGVKHAAYDHIIITSPEVMPLTPVLEQLAARIDENIICQVFDEHPDGHRDVLVSTTFRSDSPAMYFLAMFQKKDIEAINGWDENFMAGYAYEDNDFGARWVRAGLPFSVRDEIQALHQYHPRSETIPGGSTTNYNLYMANNDAKITRCTNGLRTLVV